MQIILQIKNTLYSIDNMQFIFQYQAQTQKWFTQVLNFVFTNVVYLWRK